MRLHFGQPIKSDRKELDTELPKGIPPAHIIRDVLRRKKPEVDNRIQPTVEISDEETYRHYEQWKKEQDRKPSGEGERGVWEIKF